MFGLALAGLTWSAGTAAAKTVAGTLSVVHGDQFKRAHSSEQLWIRTKAGKPQRLLLHRAKLAGLATAAGRATARRLRGQSGRQIVVRGHGHGRFLLASSVRLGRSKAKASIAKGVEKTAVLVVKFGSQAPVDKATVRSAVFTSARSVRAYYQEISHGDVQIDGKVGGANGDVFGVYKINPGTGDCKVDSYNWMDQAKSKAKKAGNNLSGYDHFMLVVPESNCGTTAGSAELGGTNSWIHDWPANPPINFIVHELGHNFGLWHANSLSCSAGSTQAIMRVAAQSVTTSCWHQEYGDPFDPMGNRGLRHFSTYYKYVLGQFSNYNTKTVSSYGDYTIQPAMANLPLGTPQMLMWRERDDTLSSRPWFTIEYRRPWGLFDDFSPQDPNVNGVLIRAFAGLNVPLDNYKEPEILDMTPWTYGFQDAALPVGKSFWDWEHNRSIKVVSATATSATVRYSQGPPAGNSIVTMFGRLLVIVGGAGKSEGIVVQRDGSRMAVTVQGSDVSVGPGCGYQSATLIHCTYSDIDRVLVNAGDGGDFVAMGDSKPADLYGGPGTDIVVGGPAGDRLYLNDGFKDYANCGGGYDTIDQDAQDASGPDCESKIVH